MAASSRTVRRVLKDEAPWKPDEIVDQYRASSPTMRELQRLLADDPDRQFAAEELAGVLGTTRQELAGAVGSYSGYIYRHWGRYSWPFAVHRDQSARRTYYAMPPEVAAVIRQQEP